MHMEFPRYINEKAHEAGYDAYITGSVFLKLHSYLGKHSMPKKNGKLIYAYRIPAPSGEDTSRKSGRT